MTFGATGLAVTAGRGTPMRVLGALVALAIGAVVFLLLEEAVGAAVPDSAGWVKEEAGLWVVSALAAIALGGWWRRHERRGSS